MLSLFLPFVLISPVAVADDNSEDEFGFIEEGEKNRAKLEADRAPNANIFLEEEEEDEQMWVHSAETGSDSEADVDEIEDFSTAGTSAAIFESDDPEEDMEGLGPDMTERQPLGDHFPLTVSRSPLGDMVAELPVLVARNSDDLQGDLWVVADIYTDGVKVSESRHFVSAKSAGELSPTYVWIKTTIPAGGPAGVVEARVFAAPPGKKESALFTRRANYSL